MSYVLEVYKTFRSIGPKQGHTTAEFHKQFGKRLGIDTRKAGNATSILNRAGLLDSTNSRPKIYSLKINCKDVEATARMSAMWKGNSPNRGTRRTKAQMCMTLTLRLASGKKVELSMVEAKDLYKQLGSLFNSVDA